MSEALKDALKQAKASIDTKGAVREAAKAKARAATQAATANGARPVQTSGIFGLPSHVEIVGVKVPSVVVIGAAGVVLLLVAGLVVHAVRARG